MERKWPVGTLALCALVFAASFLPWGRVATSLKLPFADDARMSLGQFTVEVNAWNSSVGSGSLRLPNWLVPVAALFVAAFVASRAAGIWDPGRVLCPLIVLLA